MPNIMIIGYKKNEAVRIRKMIDRLMQIIDKADDAITTILSATTKRCSKEEAAPYVIVRSTNIKEAEFIAKLIHNLNVDIEVEEIDKFSAAISIK